MADFKITSSGFEQGGKIPSEYSCDGRDVSPRLAWENAPAETETFALIVDDPGTPASTWVHWVLFNIPPELDILPQGASPEGPLPEGARQGLNSWKRKGYEGPCPPKGTHRYYFKLYALGRSLELPAGTTKVKLLEAAKRHILAQTKLMGTYSRR